MPLKLKRNNKRQKNRQNKKKLGKSIEQRPKEVETREEFGHLEADTVIGKKTKKDSTVFTLIERKTRCYKTFKIQAKDNDSVCQAITKLFKKLGDKADEVFKSITFDNGSEFADMTIFEKQSDIYYTHPYSSYERRK